MRLSRARGWIVAAALGPLLAACAGDGPPGRGVSAAFETGRWERGGVASHPLLRDGAEIVTWFHLDWVEPVPQVRVVHADGRDHAIDSPDDLRPFLRPIEAPEQAVEYGWLLRSFEIDHDTVPGFGRAFLRHDWADRLRAAGLDPEPRATPLPGGGFQVVRYVVSDANRYRHSRHDPQWLLVEVTERIGRDAAYQAFHGPAPEGPAGFDLLSLPR